MTTYENSAASSSVDATAASQSAVAVLLVDDNAAKRLALRAALAPLGYTIVEASSGEAALRCLMVQDFAVILLDVRMPVMDGFETAALIRRRRQSEMTPIIFITAYASDEIGATDRYVEGAVDFIFAPVPPAELQAKVAVFANLYSKAEQLASQAREVKVSADQLQLLTDAAPIGIFRTDADNRYVYTNPRWSDITGIAAEEATGRDWNSIIGSDSQGESIGELADGEDYRAERCHRYEIRRPHSPARIVQVISKPIPHTTGGVAGWVGTLADVTAEAGAEAAMSDARDRATEASRQKSDFLANMSHEIRTPMNGVIGMTDLLLETVLDDRQRDYAQTVRNSGEALLTIINDILDFSKVEAGMMEIEEVEFDLRGIVDAVVDLLARPAQAKGLELVGVFSASAPELVVGDPGRVRQVLTNLIGNAIKFTERGEIVVRVADAVAAGADTIVRFEVSDTGVGIAHDKFETIFQPFVQADTSTSRRHGGTGLGLAISGQLVMLMGGDCGVSSEPGQGSTFWFTIRVGPGATRASSEEPRRDADLAGVAALIVDSNATQRSMVSKQLSSWGMTTETVDSAPAALDSLRSAAAQGAPLAIAVINETVPSIDGRSLEQIILGDPALDVRIAVLSGLGEPAIHVEGDHGVICSSISKPVHPEELRDCLRVLVGLLPAAVLPATMSASAAEPPAHTDRGWLLLAEDNLINQKVAVAMLSRAGYRVDTVPNGVAAVLAVAANDYDAVLMDCQMPEMSGYAATAAIRAAEEGSGRRTPIIALTAGARREDRERCLADGMDSFLAKPVSKDALLAQVARFLRAGRGDA